MKKVKRPAETGELIEIVPNTYNDARYKIGDKFMVDGRWGDSIPAVHVDTRHERDVCVYDTEYVVLERRKITIEAITVMVILATVLVAVIYLLLPGVGI